MSPAKMQKKPFRINLALQILIIFGLVAIGGDYLPLYWQRFFYTISLTINEILLFCLPFIIFSCLLNCLLKQQTGAASFIALLFLCVIVSNYVATLVGYGAGVLGFASHWLNVPEATGGLHKLHRLAFGFYLKNPIKNTWGLGAGTLIGLYGSMRPSIKLNHWAQQLDKLCSLFLKHAFTPVLPLFALGFIIEMHHKGILVQVMHGYLPVIGLIALTEILYLSLGYFIAAGGRISRFTGFVRRALPSGVMGFSAMSSLAALPLTVDAAEQNTHDKELPKAIVPATINNHLIGNSIATPIIAMTIMASHGMDLPSLASMCWFTLYFVIAKFAIAGVPAGSVMVVQPLLRDHLGFSLEMSNLVMPLYIMIDPLITAGNVLGNGVFTIFFVQWTKRQKVRNA